MIAQKDEGQFYLNKGCGSVKVEWSFFIITWIRRNYINISTLVVCAIEFGGSQSDYKSKFTSIN